MTNEAEYSPHRSNIMHLKIMLTAYRATSTSQQLKHMNTPIIMIRTVRLCAVPQDDKSGL